MKVFNVIQTDPEVVDVLIKTVRKYENAQIGEAGREEVFFVRCLCKDEKNIKQKIKKDKLGKVIRRPNFLIKILRGWLC